VRLSANGRKLIQSFEGLSLTAYPDAAGYSIGYGHFGAQKGDVIDRTEAERLFLIDLVRFEAAVELATPRASQQQFDAMVSLAYNIGSAAFAKSTLVVRHNMGDTAGAADEFLRWNKSQGKVLPVLVARRTKERAVYLYGFAPYGSGGEPGKPPSSAPSTTRSGGGAALALLALPLVFAFARR
jgi:lysozyme